MKQEMKTLKLYITEALHVNRNTKIIEYNYHPKTTNDLKELLNKLIKERGNDANLNDIDVSEITDMSYMFNNSDFNGDVSGWDVSKVTDMYAMFYKSNFDGDISNWDVSKVTNMGYMFTYSKFNGDISNWDVSKVYDMNSIFYDSPLQKNPPKWYN